MVKFLAMDDIIISLAVHWRLMSVTHDIYNLIYGVDKHQDVFKPMTFQTMWSEYICIYIQVGNNAMYIGIE